MTTRPCVCETLEPRQLLSAASIDNAGVLEIAGPRRGSTITVTSAELGKDRRAGLKVTVNDDVYYFRLRGIAQIRIIAGRGNDVINASVRGQVSYGPMLPAFGYLPAPTVPTAVYAGAGDDVVSGSPAGDTLDGGDGDDSLRGFDGDDKLIGGDGNDTLRGLVGADTLDGGAGDDDLAGENDYVNHMPSDDPNPRNIDYPDVVTGGAGRDTFYSHDDPAQVTDFDVLTDRRIDPQIVM